MNRTLRKIAIGGLAAATLGAAGWVAFGEDLSAIASIKVEGARKVHPASIQRASGIRVGDNALALDAASAERRVEAMSLIADAEIVRDGALAVVIRVTERTPVLQIDAGDESYAVDADGVTIPGAFQDLPRLQVAGGEAPAASAVRAALRIQRFLRPRESRASAVSWGPVNGLVLRIGKRTVLIGEPVDIRTKIEAWRQVTATLNRSPRRVDVSALPRLAVS